MKAKKVAFYGLFIALAFIFSYVESLIPLPVYGAYGMKLGIANLVVLVALYLVGQKDAFIVCVIRILLVGFTFGNMYSLIYSLAGGILSCSIMILAKKLNFFSMVGTSILGGVFHNVGQIAVAIITIENLNLIYYLPILLVVGAVTGFVNGLLGIIITINLKKLM